MTPDEDEFMRREQLKKLILLGKERGNLTYSEINKHFPDDVQNPEQINSIVAMIKDMGIEVRHENAKVYPFKIPD